MKRQNAMLLKIIPVILLLLSVFFAASAQIETGEYIPVHTQEELSELFGSVKSYLDNNGEALLQKLNDTESQVVTQALIRAWGIVQYENASPQQIDDAYDALFNMTLFLGLASDPSESISTGMLFEYALQLLDQEYYDLLAASGEEAENIEYAEYLRGVAEGLVDTPEAFTAQEVEDYLLEIYQETYLAAGLKAMSHTENLPQPADLFPEEPAAVMMPNPVKQYPSAEALNAMLGITMPELPEDFGAKTGYYAVIADVVAEIEYEFGENGKLLLRLSKETDNDISGVYGAEFFEDRQIAGTMVEIDKYQSMLIARGVVKTMDEKAYAFAVDAERLTQEQFDKAVVFFVEGCANQRTGK
ncbi:MAG: hypothetical protein IJI57_15345 [Flexilinea sp.]|nr:hypothetical protein [Flexilinea sp.]